MKSLRSIGVFVSAIALSLGLQAPAAQSADSALECAPTDTIDKYRMLRQLSLDLIGRIPTLEEYEKLETLDTIDADTIAAFLSSEAYYEQMREYHRSLVWAGLDESLEVIQRGRLRLSPSTGTNAGTQGQAGSTDSALGTWRAANRRSELRGRNNVDCIEQLQTNFDAQGYPIPIRTFSEASCRDGICTQEGYVMVDPYWDRGNPVKVCAFDAQALATTREGEVCGPTVLREADCGCGPNLKYCLSNRTLPPQLAVKEALRDEPLYIFDWLLREERSYMEAFTTKTTFVNGPLAHWYKNFTGSSLQESGIGFSTHLDNLPAVPFLSEEWIQVERNDVHAGVLTTPGFHLRFGSNRSRVNRFYSAFRCEPFVAPEGGLPPATMAVPNPNLRERAGCDVCHAKIETAASHWGRWRTGGQYGYITSEELDYETPNLQCMGCDDDKNCSTFCNRHFVTQENSTHPDELAEWEGYPRAREWLSATEAEMIGFGPSELVGAESDRATVATCTVRNLAEHFLGRELNAKETLSWLPAKTEEFAASNYNFNELVRKLVTDATYRRIR